MNKTPAYTFGIKLKHEKCSETPGNSRGFCLGTLCQANSEDINFQYSYQFIGPFAYMPEKVALDHVPSYVFHKSVIIQPQGYIKYVKFAAIYAHRIQTKKYFYFIFSFHLSSGRPIIA